MWPMVVQCWHVAAQPTVARDSTLYPWSAVEHARPEAAPHAVLRCDRVVTHFAWLRAVPVSAVEFPQHDAYKLVMPMPLLAAPALY